MALRHENLIRFLMDITSPEETIKLVCNPGNAGDSLIALGTLLLMDSIGLRVSLHRTEETFNKNDKLFYGGGGNFVPYWSNCRQFLLRNQHVRQLVLLPHTVHEQSETLNQLGSNTFLFAREGRSYSHLKEFMRYPENANIDHDLGFAIGPTTIHSLVNKELPRCESKLNAFRTDAEATDVDIPRDNRDLSRLCKKADNTHTVKGIIETSRAMLNAILPFAEVRTNRLHVAIASVLLGKKTTLLDNIYFKNREIYKYSIAAHFSNVQFDS